MREGRRLPQDVLTLTSHTTNSNTARSPPPTRRHDQPTLTRSSSGSLAVNTYFPPPVKAVEIPKPHGGGTRVLGVPTVGDRVAQTVVALALEARMESIFHPDSYGYRPRRSALDAVAVCRQRCQKKDWVLDLDIQKFLDAWSHCSCRSLLG